MSDEDFTELDDGVFVRRHETLDLNIGLVVGDDEAMVIDTRADTVHGEELRRAIQRVTPLPVRWIVNTHWHWDHTFGNAAFPGAVIVGHDRCRSALLADGEQMRRRIVDADWLPTARRAAMDGSPIMPPVVTTGTELTIHCGGSAVQVRFVGRGHTDNDVVVHVGDVTFVGDLVEESAPPGFGDDSHPLDWVATLDRLQPSLRRLVVPGHGAVVDPDFVRQQREDIRVTVLHAYQDVPGTAPFPVDVVERIRERLLDQGALPD